MSVTFKVMGDPRPLARARRGRGGTMFDPASNRLNKDLVQRAYLEAVGAESMAFGRGVAIALSADCLFARPKAHFGTGRNADVLKQPAPIWVVRTPDGDNLLKLLFDSLNGLAFHDDSQVAAFRLQKRYCDLGELPHTRVRMWGLAE